MTLLARFIFASGALVVVSGIAFSQDTGQTRSITSDDFASKRPASKTTTRRPTSSARRNSRRASYNFIRKGTGTRWPAKSATSAGMKSGLAPKIMEIGLTIWKLRPPIGTDAGYKLPVNVGGLVNMWTAERVSTESVFRAGDRIRLAIESPIAGYLYILNSEIGSDGTLRPASLIFPASPSDDNSVSPGMLVDVPDQREPLPYFVMNPKKGNYAGEAIAIVISPVRLPIRTDPHGVVQNSAELFAEGLIGDAEVFARTDWTDKIYTVAESSATCGSKVRQLEREKNSKQPCGPLSRQLTREDPLPQAIYRVKSVAGKPAVALIELRTSN